MMNRTVLRNAFLALLVFALIALAATQVDAQCPMCRMSAESNLENGGSQGKGLNLGILYMLATPYLLVGTIGYWWWRNRKKSADQEETE